MNFLFFLLVSVMGLAGNVANADIADGLLAWHDFEDLVDSSGNDHNAVLFGDAYLSDGLLWLDGDEDYADIGTFEGFGEVNPLIDAQSDFTIAIAYASDSTATDEDGSLLVSVGPDDAGASGDLSLVTNDDGQAIDHWYVDGFQSEQSGVGYADGTVHLVILTYEEATAAYTFYHIDAGGNAVSHGGEEGFDWSAGWDEELDYGIRLGSHRNVVIREDEGPGFFPDLDGQIDMFAIWNRALDVSEMPLIAEYGPAKEKATDPSPSDEAEDVALDAALAWAPGAFAEKHDVYFGTDFDDVNEATTSDPRGVYQSRQDDSRYPATGTLDLEYGVTYYWRIDEVNSPPDLTVFHGDVWQFTTEPFAYPVAAENIVVTASSSDPDTMPENTIDGSGLEGDLHSTDKGAMWLSAEGGPQPAWIQYEFDKAYKLNEMWVWNYNESWELVLGVGFKGVTIDYSTDGADFAVLDSVNEFAQGPATSGYAHNTTVGFGGIVAKYVKITANSNFQGMLHQYGLSEVRFLYQPIRAREPDPASGAEQVGPEVVLGWRAGREAASHDVYLASDEDAVADGTASVVTVLEPGYEAATLDLATTYYWRVDEVNEAETPRTLEGDVWHFTTPEFLVVDDFESYDDEENVIFDAWIDGWTNDTGSTVGYFEAPFTEEEIVNSGGQSMPLYYDNTAGVTVSEATRIFDADQDWTAAGVKALTLYVHGAEDNAGGQLYVKVNDQEQTQDVDLAAEFWQEVNIDLAAFGANLKSVASLTIGIEGAGASGLVYVDDIRLYPSRCIPEMVLGDLTGDCIVDADDLAVIADNWLTSPLAVEYTFDSDLSDTSGNNRHGVGRDNPTVQAGVLTLDGSNFVDIPLGADNPFDGSLDFSIALDFRSKVPSILISSARDAEPDNHSMSVFVHHWDEPFWSEVLYDNFFIGAATAEDNPLDGEWHSVVVTYDADGGWEDEIDEPIGWATVYLDGAPGEGMDINPDVPDIAADTVRIGGSLNEEYPYEEGVDNLIGDIDNVRIFTFALSLDDVLGLPAVPTGPADLNGDGIVDQADKDIVEANMGPVSLWP